MMYDELVKRLRDWPRICVHYDGSVDQLHDEAADAIEELTRENESLAKSVNEASEILRKRWIPVTERLPESVRKSYLCLTDTGYHCEARWTNNVYGHLYTSGNEWGWSIADVPQYCEVTHWMPLPEPPKEK